MNDALRVFFLGQKPSEVVIIPTIPTTDTLSPVEKKELRLFVEQNKDYYTLVKKVEELKIKHPNFKGYVRGKSKKKEELKKQLIFFFRLRIMNLTATADEDWEEVGHHIEKLLQQPPSKPSTTPPQDFDIDLDDGTNLATEFKRMSDADLVSVYKLICPSQPLPSYETHEELVALLCSVYSSLEEEDEEDDEEVHTQEKTHLWCYIQWSGDDQFSYNEDEQPEAVEVKWADGQVVFLHYFPKDKIVDAPSQTSDGVVYKMNVTHKNCSCPHYVKYCFKKNVECKHLKKYFTK